MLNPRNPFQCDKKGFIGVGSAKYMLMRTRWTSRLNVNRHFKGFIFETNSWPHSRVAGNGDGGGLKPFFAAFPVECICPAVEFYRLIMMMII